MKKVLIDLNIVLDFLNKRKFHLEDAVIEVSSMKNNIDYIISRNISDFKFSRVPTYTPEQFFLF